MSGLVSTAEAADRLALSTRQVRNLVRSGQLHQLARGVLDATSVDRYAAILRPGTQAWAPTTAWAAIAILSGAEPRMLGPSQTSRLRSRLRVTDPAHLVERTRGRAAVTTYTGHRSGFARLAPHLVLPDRTRLGLASSAGPHLDGYVAAATVDHLVREHALLPDDDGPITLRATSCDLGVVRDLDRRAPVLAALDLAASLDPRERRAGEDALLTSIDRYSGG